MMSVGEECACMNRTRGFSYLGGEICFLFIEERYIIFLIVDNHWAKIEYPTLIYTKNGKMDV